MFMISIALTMKSGALTDVTVGVKLTLPQPGGNRARGVWCVRGPFLNVGCSPFPPALLAATESRGKGPPMADQRDNALINDLAFPDLTVRSMRTSSIVVGTRP